MENDNQASEQQVSDSDFLYEHYSFVADQGQSPLRVDKFLLSRIEKVTRNKIQQAAKAYKVYFQKVSDPETTGGYTVDHSSIVFLMGPDNNYRQHFTHRDSAEDIAEKITTIILAAQN